MKDTGEKGFPEKEAPNQEKSAYCYMVECADGTLYTGYTTDVLRRVKTHNAGKGAKYTKNRRPVRLVYQEKFSSKNEAMRREACIKKLTREEKLTLIREAEHASGSR